jgi:hypothetical protein
MSARKSDCLTFSSSHTFFDAPIKPPISAAAAATRNSSVFRHTVPRAGFSYVLAECCLELLERTKRTDIVGRIRTFSADHSPDPGGRVAGAQEAAARRRGSSSDSATSTVTRVARPWLRTWTGPGSSHARKSFGRSRICPASPRSTSARRRSGWPVKRSRLRCSS